MRVPRGCQLAASLSHRSKVTQIRPGRAACRAATIATPSMANLRLPSAPKVRAPVVSRALHAMVRSDPGFDSEELLRDLPTRFWEWGQALAGRDADRLRSCLTPTLFEQWEKGEALQQWGAAWPS